MNLYLRSVKLRGLGGGPDESRSRGVHRNDRVKYAPGHAGTGGTMVQETRPDRPRIVPMIAYEDAAAAIDWLGRAFGFRERGEGTRSRTGASAMRNSSSKAPPSSWPPRPGTTKVRSTTDRPVPPRRNGPPFLGSSTACRSGSITWTPTSRMRKAREP